ncbi:MAG: tetratricopeptide repeat protein [Planctomycetaceae bacterium]
MSRRQKLEALLAESPDDSFLQYALAMQIAAEGDPGAAALRLSRLLENDSHYVAAYFQLAQLWAQLGSADQARQVLARGIEQARRAGDDHAEGEMRGFLETLAG